MEIPVGDIEMDEHLNDDSSQSASQERPIDPLRREYVPIEKKTSKGTIVFRTQDKEMYVRLADDSIRRVTPKVNGKVAKRLRSKQRKISEGGSRG